MTALRVIGVLLLLAGALCDWFLLALIGLVLTLFAGAVINLTLLLTQLVRDVNLYFQTRPRPARRKR